MTHASSFQIPYHVRQGLVVAEAIERAVRQSAGSGYNNHVLLSISGMNGTAPTYRFEGGTVVRVTLYDVAQHWMWWERRGLSGDEPESHEWVVLQANALFRQSNKKEKAERRFGADELRALKGESSWVFPAVKSPEDITVAIYVTDYNAHGNLYITEEEPGEGGVCKIFKYKSLFPGDKERAMQEARSFVAERQPWASWLKD